MPYDSVPFCAASFGCAKIIYTTLLLRHIKIHRTPIAFRAHPRNSIHVSLLHTALNSANGNSCSYLHCYSIRCTSELRSLSLTTITTAAAVVAATPNRLVFFVPLLRAKQVAIIFLENISLCHFIFPIFIAFGAECVVVHRTCGAPSVHRLHIVASLRLRITRSYRIIERQLDSM